MTDLQQFTSAQFGDIRALSIDGDPWFVGKDIAERLGYTNPQKAPQPPEGGATRHGRTTQKGVRMSDLQQFTIARINISESNKKGETI